MARAKKKAAPTEAERVRHLLALDASNVMRRLSTRHVEMSTLFSRLRDRAPMLEVVKTRMSTATFSELAVLTPAEQTAVNRFYEQLGELTWYLQYTDDMPVQVGLKVSGHLKQLEESHRGLSATIGPPDAEGAPVVEVEVKRQPQSVESVLSALVTRGKGG
jgi:hypothetical protein